MPTTIRISTQMLLEFSEYTQLKNFKNKTENHFQRNVYDVCCKVMVLNVCCILITCYCFGQNISPEFIDILFYSYECLMKVKICIFNNNKCI